MKKLNINDLSRIYHLPLFELLSQAHEVLKSHHKSEIQTCSLYSVKTGGCPENCSYCPQSAHYKTQIDKNSLSPLADVKEAIVKAKSMGAARFCMGAAWREVRDGAEFEQVLAMVKEIKKAGMEACVTLGMLKEHQAKQLKEAGLDAYNHNLDTGPNYYSKIITTRNYKDRLKTLSVVAAQGISVCSGGIIGMGESLTDRLEMLVELSCLEKEPESIPINLLIPVPGTPLENSDPVDILELVRLIATTRIAFATSRVRLSAGRESLTKEGQVLCFYAGANSIFLGEKLLTMPNPDVSEDMALTGQLL
jgi:biotin synthase